ncbi:2OG-Fe dioxygenase family protein [Rhodopila sp.]|uniref:2OG-Fe dioxygenase family protein n=1 Tax=Rhodopila sp. TaxID=2480087 RepID=UPI003D0F72A7
MDTLRPLTDQIRTEGHSFVHGAEMRALLSQSGTLTDWDSFAASWNDLGADTYMADGGRYRKRRHAAFRATAGILASEGVPSGGVSSGGVSGGVPGEVSREVHRQPAQPHYQSRDYNTLNGGIQRWFEPITEPAAAGASMTTILSFCHKLFGQLSPVPIWHVEVHQFRIEARRGQQGRPTPEGMHRDGVDYVLVLLINRRNIASGVTSVHDLAGHALGDFTLTEPLDAALVDDARVLHGVTPVEPLDPAEPGFRDVLVVTFRRA